MGGIDSSIDSIEFNINNPSSLAKIKTTNYLSGTFYKSSSISNNSLKENVQTSNINYIAIGIPSKKILDLDLEFFHTLQLVNLQTTEDYNDANSINTRLFGADGNINKAFLSVGIPFFKYFSLGASANL